MMDRAVFNAAPLSANERANLPLGAVKPEGWLKEELRTAASGLTGKLYEFWPDVRDSAWKGGIGDGWERAPYYLDGLVPLAWLLDDEKLKAVCMDYIDWTLSNQRPDGFFGPESNEDWWPRMVMLKVLMQYYTATEDARVPEFMLRYFRYENETIEEKPLHDWAVARGAENMVSVIWLYDLTGGKHPFLLELLEKLKMQTLDWTGHFTDFPYTKGMQEIIPWEEMQKGRAAEDAKGESLDGPRRPYYATNYHLSHVVNVAMGLKAPGVMSQFIGAEKDGSAKAARAVSEAETAREAFSKGFDTLMKYHGVAHGMFTGDEHLSGNLPTQGTELCSVVELMYTLEVLLGTGVPAEGLGDLLEKLAFNALPGEMSPDLLLHQYDQQANQVRCSNEKREWYNNGPESNLFGLEPNFGCCTANLHQGWPKYAESLWYATSDEGFAAISYAPCTVRFFSGETPVTLRVETAYPFEEKIRIHVEPKEAKKFPIRLSIPEWAKEAQVCVKAAESFGGAAEPLSAAAESYEATPGAFTQIERLWQAGDVIELLLPMVPRVSRWSRGSAAVELGPLLMAFHPKEEWTLVKEHPVVPDYALSTSDKWNWALVEGGEMTAELAARSTPFGMGGGPRVYIEAAEAKDWGMEGASCAPTPTGLKAGKEDIVRIPLVPYGDTCLRISQFPVASRDL